MIATLLAFFETKLGKWIVISAMLAAALFAGALHERNVQEQKDNDKFFAERKAQDEANLKAVNALNAKYRKAEQDNAAALAADGAEYGKQIQIAHQLRDRDVADARSGARKLSVPANCPSSNSGGVPGAATDSSGAAGEARAELSPTAAGDIHAIGYEADDVARELAFCQAALVNDRNLNQPKGTP